MSVLPDDATSGPPEFLRVAGHPLRWRLLGELARCDRTVRELCGLVDEPQNLVLYHLGKLRRAQLVAGRRSSALANERSGGAVVARSAGLHPKPLHPNAVRVMREVYGIDIAGQRSKHLDELEQQRFDEVISVCDRVREACPELPRHPETVHWSTADPSTGHGDDHAASYPAFQQTAAELDTRTGFLLAAVANRQPAA